MAQPQIRRGRAWLCSRLLVIRWSLSHRLPTDLVSVGFGPTRTIVMFDELRKPLRLRRRPQMFSTLAGSSLSARLGIQSAVEVDSSSDSLLSLRRAPPRTLENVEAR